jgi:sugar phosphate isomerase/epimerase
MKRIGIQLFSLPRMLGQDLPGALALLARLGYEEVELYGPFPFSAPAARQRWEAVTPRLGFSGSGFFGRTAEEFKALLDAQGLRASSAHLDLDTLHAHMPQVGAAARLLGIECVGIPAIPDEKRGSLDAYRQMADEFNALGEAAKREGLKFLYHNHGYGLQELGGQIPLQLLLERTDPGLVHFEMDIYWTAAGGADPLDYLRAYPRRYRAFHIKDMKQAVRFSGDGGSADQWIELFPYMASAGDGVLDIPAIIAAGRKSGVEHVFVEQDMAADPETALGRSIAFLREL